MYSLYEKISLVIEMALRDDDYKDNKISYIKFVPEINVIYLFNKKGEEIDKIKCDLVDLDIGEFLRNLPKVNFESEKNRLSLLLQTTNPDIIKISHSSTQKVISQYLFVFNIYLNTVEEKYLNNNLQTTIKKQVIQDTNYLLNILIHNLDEKNIVNGKLLVDNEEKRLINFSLLLEDELENSPFKNYLDLSTQFTLENLQYPYKRVTLSNNNYYKLAKGNLLKDLKNIEGKLLPQLTSNKKGLYIVENIILWDIMNKILTDNTKNILIIKQSSKAEKQNNTDTDLTKILPTKSITKNIEIQTWESPSLTELDYSVFDYIIIETKKGINSEVFKSMVTKSKVLLIDEFLNYHKINSFIREFPITTQEVVINSLIGYCDIYKDYYRELSNPIKDLFTHNSSILSRLKLNNSIEIEGKVYEEKAVLYNYTKRLEYAEDSLTINELGEVKLFVDGVKLVKRLTDYSILTTILDLTDKINLEEVKESTTSMQKTFKYFPTSPEFRLTVQQTSTGLYLIIHLITDKTRKQIPYKEAILEGIKNVKEGLILINTFKGEGNTEIIKSSISNISSEKKKILVFDEENSISKSLFKSTNADIFILQHGENYREVKEISKIISKLEPEVVIINHNLSLDNIKEIITVVLSNTLVICKTLNYSISPFIQKIRNEDINIKSNFLRLIKMSISLKHYSEIPIVDKTGNPFISIELLNREEILKLVESDTGDIEVLNTPLTHGKTVPKEIKDYQKGV